VRALAGIAQAIAATGDPGRARRLFAEAETIARTISDPARQAWALDGLAEAVAAAGDADQAEGIARRVRALVQQAGGRRHRNVGRRRT
jgi:hypothetical protein